MQFTLATIADSDGTRHGVLTSVFSERTIPADRSLLGLEFGIDDNGDVTVGDVSIYRISEGVETYVTSVTLDLRS